MSKDSKLFVLKIKFIFIFKIVHPCFVCVTDKNTTVFFKLPAFVCYFYKLTRRGLKHGFNPSLKGENIFKVS